MQKFKNIGQLANSKYEDGQHQFEMVLHLSQGEVPQVAEERSENESQKDKEGEVGHQVEPFSAVLIKCPRRMFYAYHVRIREYMGRNGAKEPET